MPIKIKNILMNSIYQLIAVLFPLVTMPLVARNFTPEVLSQYSYTYSIAYIFYLFAKLGVDNYGVREISVVTDENVYESFWNIYKVQISAGILSLLIYLGIVSVMFSNQIRTIAYIQSLWIISGLLDISWLFIGRKQIQSIIIRNLAIKVVILAGVVVLSYFKLNIIFYTIVMATGNLMGSLVNWFNCKRIFINGISTIQKAKSVGAFSKYSLHVWRDMIILFVPVLAITAYTQLDSIIVGNMLGIGVVALYQYAVAIINIPKSIIGAVGTVMIPEMTSTLDTHKDINLTVTLRIVIIFSAYSAGFIIVFGDQLIQLLLGQAFTRTGELITTFAISIVFFGLGNVIRTQVLIPQKYDTIYLKSFVIGAVTNVVGNIFFITKFGLIGAVYAQILTDASISLYSLYKIKRKSIDIKILPELFSTFLFIICIGKLNDFKILLIIISIYSVLCFYFLIGSKGRKRDLYLFLKR